MKNKFKYIVFVIVCILSLSGCGCTKKKEITIDLDKTEEISFENLKIDIPSAFKEDLMDNNSDDGKTYYLMLDEEKYNQCNFTISNMPDDNKSLDYYIDNILGNNLYDDLDADIPEEEIEEENTTYDKVNISGTQWAYYKYTDDIKNKHYIYVSKNNNKVYSIVFNSINDDNTCSNVLNKMLNSFKF